MQLTTQPVTTVEQPLRLPTVPTWMWVGAAALGVIGGFMAWRQYRQSLGG